MKYRVIGQNRDNGARQSLEFEAESKAAAERKATQAGMSVTRVEDITDGHAATALETRSSKNRGGGGFGLKAILIVLLLAGVAYVVWPRIRSLVGI